METVVETNGFSKKDNLNTTFFGIKDILNHFHISEVQQSRTNVTRM